MTASLRIVLASISVLMLFSIWWFGSHTLKWDQTILPPPEAVLGVLNRGVIGGVMHVDILYTLYGAGAGLIIGSLVALVAGILVGESKTVSRFFYPVILGAQSMPTIAIAPLLAVWLGIDLGSKIILVAFSCFFPVFISTVAGLAATNGDLSDLFRVFAAGRFRTLWELRLPSALNYIFSGLQVAVVVSLIVCVVGEFVSSVHGLGHLIKVLSDQLDVSSMFAAIVLLALIGSIASAATRYLHRRIVFWQAAARVQTQ
ncbi:NitT/TauT family transport system permease protein [Bradyrhizobium sp. AZCC 2262]|uniref:ABC transporter permease n=1 Tax=Bradyrhizobium sp. AZCC 2262 TaxID=3117022 RepID=UPI002FF35785